MGTTTIFMRQNDMKRSLSDMTKKELAMLDDLSPYKKEQYTLGWHTPLELHNGNIYQLVFWKGRLIKLNDAPKILNRHYYNKYTGKTMREYEWTLLKRMLLRDIAYLDKQFKKLVRKAKHAPEAIDGARL